MKRIIPFFFCLTAFPLSIDAQDAAPATATEATTEAPASTPMTMEERKASINQLETYIAEREERADAVREDIVRLDERVESGIQKIVDKLKSVQDSKDSQVRVAMTKEHTIDALKKTIEYYARKRDDLRELLRSGSEKLSEEDAQKALKAFDDRINKRIQQIIELAESFNKQEDFNKYVRTNKGGSRWSWNRNRSSVRINENWRHNRKIVRHTDKQSADIAKALEASLDRLERRAKTLEENLKATNLSEQQKATQQEELDYLTKMFNDRLGQLEAIDANVGGGAKQSISRNAAFDMQKAIDDAAKDLRQDFFAIFEKYDDFTKRREQINALEKNLAARKKWLEENAPE